MSTTAGTSTVPAKRAKYGDKAHCCVPQCTNDARYDGSLSFHRFPQNEKLRKTWIINIKRDLGKNFKITGNTRVCSAHFVSDDFKPQSLYMPGRRLLKEGSVPTVFAWSVNKKSPRRQIVRHHPSETHPEEPITQSLTEAEVLKKELALSQMKLEHMAAELREVKAAAALQKEHSDAKIKELERTVRISRFGLERYSNSDTDIKFYTGFPSYEGFCHFFELVKPTAETMVYIYASGLGVNRPGIRKMQLIDELFMFCVRLRLGLFEFDLADRFHIHISTVSRKIATWANFLYFFLGSQPIWPSRERVNELMPNAFRELYPTTRVILDCTEIYVETPSSMLLQSQMYSMYKSSTTLKCLIGIAPHGAVTFVSSLCTGSISDKEITRISGILDLLEPHDGVMADKGFDISDLLRQRQVTLNMPPFRIGQTQFPNEKLLETKSIARLRVHVERSIRRLKEFHLFSSDIRLSTMGSINQIVTVACLLSNFQGPLMKDAENESSCPGITVHVYN